MSHSELANKSTHHRQFDFDGVVEVLENVPSRVHLETRGAPELELARAHFEAKRLDQVDEVREKYPRVENNFEFDTLRRNIRNNIFEGLLEKFQVGFIEHLIRLKQFA